MNEKNNIAPSDAEEINAIIAKHFGDDAAASQRAYGAVVEALSRLRASVAEEMGKLPDYARSAQGQRVYSLAYARGRKKGNEEARAALASAPVAGKSNPDLAPSNCPITGRPFFMSLKHPELGLVPTYGGPFDSYTIPQLDGKPDQPWHERELFVHRYDHDLGGWVMDSIEVIPLRIIHDSELHRLQEAAEQGNKHGGSGAAASASGEQNKDGA